MKMRSIMKYISGNWATTLLAICSIILFSSCSDMTEYEKFIEDGEITYTGKADSLTIYSGKNRVLVEALLIADPKITEARIYWDGDRDSVVVPIDRSEGVDTLRTYINDITEQVHNFKVVTYNRKGDPSVPVFETGTVYGDRYRLSLLNRPVVTNELFADNGTANLQYGEVDRTSGAFESEIKYTTADGDQEIVTLSVDEPQIQLENYELGTEFETRTLYLPDSTSIDTFYTDYRSVSPDLVYLRNTGPGFERTAETSNGRRGILTYWTTNNDVKNANGQGGYDNRDGGLLSFEGGYGLPAIPNGKIYQTVNLPSGSYTFSGKILRQNNNGTKYIAVAEGAELPDVGDVPDASVSHYLIKGSDSEVSIDFELSESAEVSVGFVAMMPNTGSFINFSEVSFTEN
jgi:hypothetical protein